MRFRGLTSFVVICAVYGCGTKSGDDGSNNAVRAVPGGACRADSDCIPTETCQNGACAPPPTSGCTSDADCSSGETCVSGVCTPVTTPICQSDADCATGETCVSGVCTAVSTPLCQSDADCASGEICRADGACVPNPWACTTDADCPARSGYVCMNGQCGPSNTSGCNGSNCPCDVIAQDCSNGLRCYPAGDARGDGQCFGQGGVASGGACVEPPLGEVESCSGANVCIYQNELDPTGLCHALCLADADCPSGEACRHLNDPFGTGQVTEWGVCLVPPVVPPPPCDAITQNCPAGQMCVAHDLDPNTCEPAGSGAEGSSCRNASQCSPGLACVAFAGSDPTTNFFTLLQAYIDRGGGTCRALCDAQVMCSPGESCSPVLPSSTGVPRSDFGVCD